MEPAQARRPGPEIQRKRKATENDFGPGQPLIALLARFSIAAVFWKSGQTKIEGLKIDIVDGTFNPGWPRLAVVAVVEVSL